MRRMTVRFLLVSALAFGLLAGGSAGCSKEEPAPQQVVRRTVTKGEVKPVDNQASRPAETQAARPPVAFYTPAGKRDPFVPFMKFEQKEIRTGMDNVPPLQRYDLGELKFVGVIWGPKGAYALIEDGEGRGYTVTAGMKIGRGGGTVQKISDGEVLVREEHRDNTGAVVVRRVPMKLQSAGGK